MKKNFKIAFVLLIASLIAVTIRAQADLVACGGDQVVMIDSRKSTPGKAHITWTWKVGDAVDLPGEYRKIMVPLDECKPVKGGKQLLITSSGGGVALLDVASKKVLFYANAPMAHSTEMLPGGKIAVALSTHAMGNSLELYDSKKSAQRLFRDSLYSGHGVVWNGKLQRLFALGFDELRSYRLADWNSVKPLLVLERSWKLPDEGGHDLSTVNDNEMIVSTHRNVFKFDIKKQQFAVFEPLAGKHDIKSANYNKATQRLVYTQAEQSWWTFNIYSINPSQVISIPDIKLYKVRILK
ncbi:DUF6528 family protein [Niabella yanshanensis]|uniref:DUF6528 family protein n=1 Tax=Niabella yanshanensis TaxID=577386 RepID=A0ABZ0WAJ7_9BACT|nr:DUF6528 family protein [Niabella yanshanensis]WQD40325.1 DUF6528 family protein [Niabella yanshanensis]